MHAIVRSSLPPIPLWTSLTDSIVHAWNYRRYVLANMPVPRPAMNEIDYTMQKIKSNFSNFSAWHHRSKVLPTLWQSGALDPKASRETGTSVYCPNRDSHH